jgi:hypothetical protein
MDVPPTLPIPSNKKIFLQIQISKKFENGLGFFSLQLQDKVLSRGVKVMKYMPEAKHAKKS